jgi:DNA-binding GntR family transcriptional regulator
MIRWCQHYFDVGCSLKSTTRNTQETRVFDGSVKEQVYRLLKADILGGTFELGESLNESQLSAKYEVSRAPLREALAMLQRDGLLEALPRTGYVTSRVTPQDVEDIFDLRILIESATIQKAALSISEANLQRLEQLCSEFQPGDRGSYRVHLAENLEFHRIIAEAAGNRRTTQVLIQLLEHMGRLLILRLDFSTGDEVVKEHLELAAALRQRNPVLARDLMVHHLDAGREATVRGILRLIADWHL